MTKNRKMASFVVSPFLIEQALKIPDGHEIVGAEWDFSSRTVRLFVEGPDLPEVKRGDVCMSITPSVTEAVGEDGKRVHTWHWNAEVWGGAPTGAASRTTAGLEGADTTENE